MVKPFALTILLLVLCLSACTVPADERILTDERILPDNNEGTSPESESTDIASMDAVELDIETLLLQNIAEIIQIMPEYHQNPLPLSEKSHLIWAVAGDIDGDSIDDLVVVVELIVDELDEYHGFGSRHIYVLHCDANGNYSIIHKNESLILEEWRGGVFGDPLESITIEDGILAIHHYGGSSSRWGYQMCFAYDNNRQFVLTDMTVTSSSTRTANGEETICDFINHKIERYSWGDDESQDCFLYGGDLPNRTYLFDDVTFDEIADYGNIPFLPDLGDFQFDRFNKPIDLRITASQALDMVMAEYYSGFEKISIPWTRENRNNYSQLLFYEVPDHYYQSSDGILDYYRLEVFESDSEIIRMEHVILFHTPDINEWEFYRIEDK